MRIKKPEKKLYYSLRQVVEMLGISDNVLKNWEREFPQIQPVRNRAGNRNYLEKDVKLLFYIKDLLYNQKMSMDEVREHLKTIRLEDLKSRQLETRQLLAEVQMELREILEILNSSSGGNQTED